MANVPMPVPYFRIQSTNGTNTYIIGNGNASTISSFGVTFVDEGSASVSIVVKSRAAVPQATDNSAAFQTTGYRKPVDNSFASAALATFTTPVSIIIPATGLQIALDVTYTSGKLGVYVQPLSGTAAI